MEELECSEVKMLVAAHDGDGPEFWCSAEHRRHLDDLGVLWSGNRRILRVKAAGPVEAVGFQLVDADRIRAACPLRCW